MPEVLTKEYLKSILNYDSETGLFKWKYRDNARRNWNTKYADKQAGAISKDGYVKINIGKIRSSAHRLAWFYAYGYFPEEVDHIDVNPGNNRLDNLRAATRSQNQCNCRPYSTNRAGYKGVMYNKINRKWVATITINRKAKYLGSYNSAIDAHTAYQVAANSLHGEFARMA